MRCNLKSHLTTLFVILTILVVQAQGPYQPEHTSFESISTTDMVNLSTGDFTYNIPLIHVPGPEGGFSMPLSYHAGIKLNQEASWVGLGWNINPGAITRSISNYPDDYDGTTNYYSLNHDNGGVKEELIINLYLIGIPIIIGITWDSRKGYGGTISYNGIVTVGVGNNQGLTVMGVTINSDGVSVDPLGVVLSSLSLNSEISRIKNGFSHAQPNAGTYFNSIGQQLVSLGERTSNLNSWTFKKTKKLYYSRERYYLHHSKFTSIYGVLYMDMMSGGSSGNFLYGPNSSLGQGVYKYNLATSSSTSSQCTYFSENMISDVNIYSKPYLSETSNNPTSLTKDIYRINAAGISGNITPFRTDIGSVVPFNRNTVSDGYNSNHRIFEPISFKQPFMSKTNFIYDGDASNYYDYIDNFDLNDLGFTNYKIYDEQTNGDQTITEWYIGDDVLNLKNINRDNSRDEKEFNFLKNHLSSGKNIEWYTNEEIKNGQAKNKGFIDFQTAYLRTQFRADLPQNGIGGFTVTKIDGLTYHFSLPVYNFSITDYTSTNLEENFSTSIIKEPYATSWLLTAITGSDYVSRGSEEGVISDKDWGYWVKFDYGKFSEVHPWRVPYNDLTYSSQTNYKGTFSSGERETYFLNSIKTRTHSAFFIKELREDNRSSYVNDYQIVKEDVNQGELLNLLLTNFISSIAAEVDPEIDDKIENLTNQVYNKLYDNDNDMYLEYYSSKGRPASNLALKEIIIVENKNSSVFSNGGYHNQDVISTDNFSNILHVDSYFNELDIPFLKRIEFITDYSLCKGSPNSFASATNPPEPGEGNGGKLTLKEIKVFEKNNSQVLPSYKFEYGENPNYNKDNWDGWGMYKSNGIGNKYGHAATPHAEHWSLNKITSPLGGEIHIDYERDTYASVSGEPNVTKFPIENLFGNKSVSLFGSESYLKDMLFVGDVVELEFKCILYGSIVPVPIVREYSSVLTISSISPDFIEFEEVLSADYLDDMSQSNLNLNFKNGTIRFVGNEKYGGNLRVAKISTADELQNKQTTKYIYTKNGKPDGPSSGCVSVEPQFIKAEERSFEKYYDYPVTPVLYENVTVLNGFQDDESYLTMEKYDFMVPNSSIIKYESEDIGNVSDNSIYKLLSLDIHTNSIGQIKSIKKYNSKGLNVSSTLLKYTDDSEYDKLGLFEEATILAEKLRVNINNSVNDIHRMLITKKKYHPSILKSLTINEGGVVKRIENTKYDLVTGNVLETEYSNSLGEMFRSEVIPAYHKYPEMGSKALNPNNKNMMSQKAADYLYSLNGVGEEEVISASVQTWNEDWTYRDFNSNSEKFEYTTSPNSNIWRKHKTYIWNGSLNDNGTYANFTDFDWEAAPHSNWKNVQEYTLFNHYSKPLEVQDINYNKSASKMGYGNAHTLLAAANSRYTESYYSGAEDKLAGTTHYFEGEVKGANLQSNTYAHTGEYSVKTLNTNDGFSVSGTIGHSSDFSVQDYRASVWVYKKSYKKAKIQYKIRDASNAIIHQGGSNYTSSATIKAGDWYLLQLDIPKSKIEEGSALEVYTTVKQKSSVIPICYFDDFRLLPLKASLNAYVYDKWGNLTAVLDHNNLATKYHYDEAGRLLKVEREFSDDVEDDGGFKKMKEFEYNYAREIE